MSNSSYKKQIESTKAQIKYLESLTPEERRAAIIKMRKGQTRSEIFVLIMVAGIGLSLFGVAIYSWVVEYNMSLMSSLGVAGGVILNMIGFRYFQSNRSESANKILSDDFTDEDILAYFREREQSDQNAFEQWNKRNKYFVALFLIVLMSLYFVSSAREFAVMAFISGISMFSIGFVAFAIVRPNRYGN